ncbi:MAG: carbohydrate kinase [Acidimicrobiales bacterium]
MILSAGEALVDVLPDGRAVPGGGPMNAAIAVARLGAPGGFLGRVSTDAHGDAIWAHLEASGVDLRFAQRGPEPTAQAIVTTVPVQSFEFVGEGTADACLEPLDVEAINSTATILHGGTLGIFRGTTAHEYQRVLASFDGIVSFDPNVRPQIMGDDADAWWRFANAWLDRADLVRGSDEDFDWMATTPTEVLERGASVVIRTVGPEGVAVHLASGEIVDVPAKRVDVVDTVGAGDSFCGAVLTQLYERNAPERGLDAVTVDEWREIAAFGVAVAAITVSRAGANPPWRRELALS